MFKGRSQGPVCIHHHLTLSNGCYRTLKLSTFLTLILEQEEILKILFHWEYQMLDTTGFEVSFTIALPFES